MIHRFGDRGTFAVEVGEVEPHQLRVVDLWAAGHRLTVKDNWAYVPQFALSMRHTVEDVRRREVPRCPWPGRPPEKIYRRLHHGKPEFRQRFWFMHWGPTVDNLSTYAYLDRGDLVMVIAFYGKRGVHVVRTPPEDFVAVLEAAADRLEADHASR